MQAEGHFFRDGGKIIGLCNDLLTLGEQLLGQSV